MTVEEKLLHSLLVATGADTEERRQACARFVADLHGPTETAPEAPQDPAHADHPGQATIPGGGEPDSASGA